MSMDVRGGPGVTFEPRYLFQALELCHSVRVLYFRCLQPGYPEIELTCFRISCFSDGLALDFSV